jgi:hypothetical protein
MQRAVQRGGILDDKHCLMSYVGRDYGGPGVFPRLALVGMDHKFRIGGGFMARRLGIEKCYQNGGDEFNEHYKGVVKTAAAVFGSAGGFCQRMCRKFCQKSRALPSLRHPACCVLDRIAQPNAVKCVSKLATDSTCKATGPMWDNCAHHLVAELRILRPEVVIFHGAKIQSPVTKAIKELEQIEKEIANGQRQLSNEQFLAKAPAKVVEGMRARAQELAVLRDKAHSKLEELKTT